MPHTLTQDVNSEQLEEYSKALAEDCMISGIYESATLYAKKESDNLYDVSFIAYESQEKKQILRSSTRIFSKVDLDKLINTLEEVYKIFSNKIPKENTSIKISSDSIKITFNLYGTWIINITNINKEEIDKLKIKIS